VGSGDPKDVRFQPDLDILAYENAQPLDELLRQRPPPEDSTEKVTEPKGRHLELLRRIHEHLKEEGTWPEAVPFAVKHRDLGSIRELVVALGPEFIRTRWQGTRNHRSKLDTKSLPLVASMRERNLLALAVKTMAQLWLETDAPELDISAEMVALKLQVKEELLPGRRWTLLVVHCLSRRCDGPRTRDVGRRASAGAGAGSSPGTRR
jgi:hypothetical protein